MANFERAVIDSDVVLAESILDPRYQLILVQPAPATMPRTRWLEVLPDYMVHEYDVESQQLDVDGDTAAVLSRIAMSATVLGEDRSGVFIVSDIWRQREDGWKVWRRHSTPLTAGSLDRTR
jgi:Domain of unknown function (DUF4440)